MKEAAGGKGRCEFVLHELLCGQGPVPSVRHPVPLPSAIPSPQRLLQLILEQLLAGVGRNTIDRHKSEITLKGGKLKYLWHYWWCVTTLTSSPSPESLIWQRHLMWDVRNTWAIQIENCSACHSFVPCLQYKHPLLLSFSVRFFSFLDICLTACLKLPLLNKGANTLVSKLRYYCTGGDLSLGFSRDHSSLLGLSAELYSTLETELLKESLTSYVGTLIVWKLRFAPWFPPTPLAMVPFGFWGRRN